MQKDVLASEEKMSLHSTRHIPLLIKQIIESMLDDDVDEILELIKHRK